MKKFIIIILILFSLVFLFHYAYTLGLNQKAVDYSAYYVTTGHCIEYNVNKNRTTFRTPRGIDYYYYNDFVYTLNNLDFYLIMNNNNTEYLFDDYIMTITPIPKDEVDNFKLTS